MDPLIPNLFHISFYKLPFKPSSIIIIIINRVYLVTFLTYLNNFLSIKSHNLLITINNYI